VFHKKSLNKEPDSSAHLQGKPKFLQKIRHFARRPCMNDKVLNPE